MKKKTVVLLAAALAVVIVVLAGFPLFSRLYYHRSQAATLFAWQLHKDAYTTDEAFDGYIAEKRDENARPYTPPAEELTVSLESGSFGGMDYYILNAGGGTGTLLVYFAGGSFVDRPRPVHWQFLNALAEDTGAAILAPIYPKLPEADASACYAVLRDFCGSVLADMPYGRLIFMGDSAGGGMALSLAMQLRDGGGVRPDKIIAVCPWVDVTMENPEIAAYEKKDPALDSETLSRLGTLWAGGLDGHDPMVSPLYGSFEGLGEITLVTSKGELLYPDIMALDGALTGAGISHNTIVSEGMFHVWPLYQGYNIPESGETYQALADIIAEG